MRGDVYGNCLTVINNGSARSVLIKNTPGLFPAIRKTLEHTTAPSALNFFFVMKTALSFSKSTECTEPLLIASIENVQTTVKTETQKFF